VALGDLCRSSQGRIISALSKRLARGSQRGTVDIHASVIRYPDESNHAHWHLRYRGGRPNVRECERPPEDQVVVALRRSMFLY